MGEEEGARGRPLFKSIIASLCDRYNYLFGALILAKSLSYWLYAFVKFPHTPFSVLVMYRDGGGDMTYFPMIAGLAQSGLHQAFVKEFAGTGVGQFPIFSILPFAVLTNLFGPAGYIVADLVFAFATFASLAVLFRLLGASAMVSRCTALLVVLDSWHLLSVVRYLFAGYIVPRLMGLSSTGWQYDFPTPVLQIGIPATCALLLAGAMCVFFAGPKNSRLPAFAVATAVFATSIILISGYFFELWGWRLPRPLAIGVFTYVAMASLLYLLRAPGYPGSTPWVVFGVGFAVLAQSYFYTTVTLGIVAIFVLIYLLWRQQTQISTIFRNTAVSVATIVILCIPLIYQQIWATNPDIFRRLGGYTLGRLSFPHFWPEAPESIEIVFSMAIAIMLLRLRPIAAPAHSPLTPKLGIGFLASLVAASLLALPFSVLALGRAIQVGHFLYEFYEALSLTIVALLALSVDFLLPAATDDRLRRNILTAFVASVVLLAIASIAEETLRPNKMVTAIRTDFDEYAGIPDYRNGFSDLVHELDKPVYRKLVLGSLDVQVQSWWSGFERGYVYLPDVSTSDLRDTEIETRLITFAKTIGMNEDQFVGLINMPYARLFFLSHAKYMASTLHTFAPITDYSPEDQAKIRQTSIFSTFQLFIPISEMQRLRKKYEDTNPSYHSRELDLIVLSKSKSLARFAPSPDKYRLVYQNATFRLWQKFS